MFTFIANDNIDKNDKSNTASFYYREISKTVIQFPMADIPGDNLTIHRINEEDGYDLTSILSSYSIVPQGYHCKKPLNVQVLTFQGIADGSVEVLKEALIEEYRWLETVVDAYQTESIISSWSKYHSNKDCNAQPVKRYYSLLPLTDAPVQLLQMNTIA